VTVRIARLSFHNDSFLYNLTSKINKQLCDPSKIDKVFAKMQQDDKEPKSSIIHSSFRSSS
jgi:hypothetical protein